MQRVQHPRGHLRRTQFDAFELSFAASIPQPSDDQPTRALQNTVQALCRNTVRFYINETSRLYYMEYYRI